MKKTFPVLLALFLCPVQIYFVESPGISFFKTPHFAIKYNENVTPYASVIAERAEAHYRNIESFLSYSLDEETKILISDGSSLSPLQGYNSIKLSSSAKFDDADIELYRQIFNRFLNSIFSQTSGIFKFKTINDVSADMLCSYSITGFNINNELILKDKFLHSGNNKISIIEFDSFNGYTGKAVYAGFFYFIESAYGRKVLLRALKDTSYYGSFLSSLSSVTGKSFEEFNTEFNNFLSGKFAGAASGIDKTGFSDLSINGFVSDFFINNDMLTVLADNGAAQSIVMFDLKTGKQSLKTELPGNYNFRSICPVYDNKLAAAGDYSDGASVFIYDTDPLSMGKEIRLPGVYINSINNSGKEGVLLLNSVCGIAKGIIEADYSSGVLNKKNGAHITGSSDIIFHSGSVYYTAKRELYELVEYNVSTGEERSVLKQKDEIVSLSLSGGSIVVTSNNSSGGYVSLFNRENGSLKTLASGCPLLYKTFTSDKNIYMLAYYNGSRRIIIKELPQ